MTKKLKLPAPNKGKGYVAVWQNGKLGWWLPNHLYDGRTNERPNSNAVTKGYLKGERVFLCEIIIKPLKDKKGRPITKIVK